MTTCLLSSLSSVPWLIIIDKALQAYYMCAPGWVLGTFETTEIVLGLEFSPFLLLESDSKPQGKAPQA